MSRVLVDTTVIVSAVLFPGSTPADALAYVLEHEDLVLTQWIIDELHDVVRRKWPDRMPALVALLQTIPYTLAAPLPTSTPMRDTHDQPILDAAIAGAIDVLITGDKDFLALTIDLPRILTARQYLDDVR